MSSCVFVLIFFSHEKKQLHVRILITAIHCSSLIYKSLMQKLKNIWLDFIYVSQRFAYRVTRSSCERVMRSWILKTAWEPQKERETWRLRWFGVREPRSILRLCEREAVLPVGLFGICTFLVAYVTVFASKRFRISKSFSDILFFCGSIKMKGNKQIRKLVIGNL